MPPPASAKPAMRVRREAIVGADRGAGNAAGRGVGSERRIAVGGLRAAKAGRPHAPARLERHRRRRLGEHGIGVASLAGCVRWRHRRWRCHFLGERLATRRRSRHCPAIHEGIGQQAHEQVHGIEGGLLRSGRDLAGSWRQPGRRQRAESMGIPPVVLKKLVSALATFCWLPLRPLPEVGNSASG